MYKFCVRALFGIVFALTMLSLVILTSVGRTELPNDPYRLLIMQSIFLGVGLVAMTVFYRIDYRHYTAKPMLWALAVGMVALLVCVLLPGIGKTVAGSRRWIGLGPVNMQPAEFVKLGVVIFLSAYYERAGALIKRMWRGFVLPTIPVALCLLLILAQPDFGSSMVVTGIACLTFLVCGVPFRRLALLGGLSAILIGALLVSNPNRMARLAKEGDGENYQATQSELAFQNGGITGVGLGKGLQKERYLPERHTDFILAIIAEDLGLIATGSVLLAYVFLLGCGSVIALGAKDKQGMALAMGATILLCGQAAANIAVVTHVFPTKGLALPFISYGGSCLIASYSAIGLLLNVGRVTLESDAIPTPPSRKIISIT